MKFAALLMIMFAGFLSAISPAFVPRQVAAEAPACNAGIGLKDPVPVCSKENPCTRLLLTYAKKNPARSLIDTASDRPICSTGTKGVESGRPFFNDGPARVLLDNQGTQRYFCEFRPEPGAGLKKPLVIFVHGSSGTAQNVYDLTSLRSKAAAFKMSGESKNAGFVLVSSQARNLHWPSKTSQDGTKYDHFYRDYENNPDVVFFDRLIDSLVAEGSVDASRIYLSGWSNGGHFTAFYGIYRHEHPTPGGNRVAAVANYSAGDPYRDIDIATEPSCAQDKYPRSNIGFLLVSRSCDVVACEKSQSDHLANLGLTPSSGNIASEWTTQLSAITPNASWQIIDDNGKMVTSCAANLFCGPRRAFQSHLNWPDAGIK